MRLGPERARPRSAPLTGHERDLLVPVDVSDAEASDLAPPHASIRQEPDDRGVAPIIERLGLASVEQTTKLVVG